MGDRSTIVLLATLAVSLVLAAFPSALADADDATDSLAHGCAVTPGGWGSPPAGGNPGALLHANFDRVFGGSLTVGGVTFTSAQQITEMLPVHGDPLFNHAVALTINFAFGEAGLLDGTVAGVIVTGGPYYGMSVQQVLSLASAALADPARSTSKYSELIGVMDAYNNELLGCNAGPETPCGAPGAPVCYTPPCGVAGQPACPPPVCPAMGDDVTVLAYESDDGFIWIRFTPPLSTAEERFVLLPGDLLSAFLTVAPGCADVTLSLVAYAEVGDGFVVYDSDTGTFDAGTHALEVELPPCSYLVYLVRGEIVADLTGGNPYGDRLLDWEMGGEGPCELPPCGTPGQPACPEEPCGTAGQPACPTVPCGTPGAPACPAPTCPANVVATALDAGAIRLTWSGVAGAEAYLVYRDVPDAPMTLVGTVEGTTFVDEDTEVGETYSYMVKAVVDGNPSGGCTVVSATAIPFFTNVWVGALATLGALGAFVMLRRRA